jgi:hypothetical protein
MFSYRGDGMTARGAMFDTVEACGKFTLVRF